MNSHTRKGGSPLWRRGVLIGGCCLALFGLIYPIVGGMDLWGHLYFGLETLDSGSLHRTNTFSYAAPEHPWFNHEWLFEVLLALAYRVAGSPGIVLLILAFGAATLALASLWTADLQHRKGRFRTETLLVALFFFLPIYRIVVYPRPQLATYLLTFIFLALLDRASRLNRISKVLWILPLLIVPWTNLHGGFLVGLCLLLAFPVYLATRGFLDREAPALDRRLLLQATALVPLSAMATLLNPYGYHHWRWLFRSLSVPRPEISEWRSTFYHLSEPAVLGWAVSFVALLALLVWKRWRGVDFMTFAFLCMSVMAFKHVRHYPLALLAGIPAALASLDAFLRRFLEPETSTKDGLRVRRLAGGAVNGLLVLIGLVIVVRVGTAWSAHGPLRIPVHPDRVPVEAFQLLRDNQVSGNLATHYDWGQAAIWHLYPEIKVNFDGRFRTAYPSEVLKDGLTLYRGTEGWERMLTEYPTTLLLLPAFFDSPTGAVEIAGQTWVILYRDAGSVLLARDVPENEDLLRRFFAGELKIPEPLERFAYFP